jgi:ribonucleoside-triphosphate reductase
MILLSDLGIWGRISTDGKGKARILFKAPDYLFDMMGELQEGKIGSSKIDMTDTAEVIGIEEVDLNRYSYDVTTASSHFTVNSLYSHNCRSFLAPWKNEKGEYQFYGRQNLGVVTINLADVGLTAHKDEEAFWHLFDERLELCRRALMIRFNSLKGVKSDVAPILYQHGALARLKPGETIDSLLYGGRASISLGYAGLYECVKAMKGCSHTEPEGYEFAIKVMQHLNDACEKWKAETNIGFSVYGTPIENTTEKFAKCIRRRHGIIEGITDKLYLTNSFHVTPAEHIDAFSKLSFESNFQKLSLGGVISYVETPNLTKNISAILELIKHISAHTMYAEINTMTSYCYKCGCTDIQMGDDLKFHCPVCGNDDFNKMNIAVRVCGYISTNPFNDGRADDIHSRVYHLGDE